MPPIRQVSRKVGRHGAFKGCNIINETPAFEYQAFTHRLDQQTPKWPHIATSTTVTNAMRWHPWWLQLITDKWTSLPAGSHIAIVGLWLRLWRVARVVPHENVVSILGNFVKLTQYLETMIRKRSPHNLSKQILYKVLARFSAQNALVTRLITLIN